MIDRENLVSGVNVVPRVCDYAGIEPPPNMRGYSLRLIAEGQDTEWREFVVSHTSNCGTMLRNNSHKLKTYKNDPVVQLFDLEVDLWEPRNLTEDADSASLVRELQKTLENYESEFELAEL